MWLDEPQRQKFREILHSPSTDILELARIAGLTPGEAFRYADLRGVSFGTADLDGYDFTGADLRGADFSAARLDGWIGDATTRSDETTHWPPAGPPAFRAPPDEFWHGTAPPGFASDWGSDKFGPWLEFAVPAAKGAAVTQRLRWIESGTFLMGSSKYRRRSREDEGPQHWVTIGQGFWLFDMACTQALWQAVMGDNPSHFKGNARNPVENVSWDDCGKFLTRINDRVRGLDLRLPSEAEWEYACRAGTTTPFSFGDMITPDQVNYNGNDPYLDLGGSKGLYRKETVPVGSLPANPWGLYEMHGNVWEWCADLWHKNYQGAPRDGSAWLASKAKRLTHN
jgi:formylglycine-generating enzyme required for sulfatase activity